MGGKAINPRRVNPAPAEPVGGRNKPVVPVEHVEPNEPPLPTMADAHDEAMAPPLPVFWTGKAPLQVGNVLKQDGHTVIATHIFTCINGAVIIGAVIRNGEMHNVNVTKPEVHKLASWPTDTEEHRADLLKYWEYELQ